MVNMRPNIDDVIVDRGVVVGRVSSVLEPAIEILISDCWRIILYENSCKCKASIPVIIRYRDDAWHLL